MVILLRRACNSPIATLWFRSDALLWLVPSHLERCLRQTSTIRHFAPDNVASTAKGLLSMAISRDFVIHEKKRYNGCERWVKCTHSELVKEFWIIGCLQKMRIPVHSLRGHGPRECLEVCVPFATAFRKMSSYGCLASQYFGCNSHCFVPFLVLTVCSVLELGPVQVIQLDWGKMACHLISAVALWTVRHAVES